MDAVALSLVAVQGATIALLAYRGLTRPYLWLIVYLAWSMARGTFLAGYDVKTVEYTDLWLLTLPGTILAQVLVAAESYRRSMEELPGASRLVHLILFSLCLLASAGAQLGQTTFTAGGVWSRAQQAVAMVLVLTSIGIAAWAQYLRPHRRRNVVAHERILAVHLGGLAILVFALHRGISTGYLNVAVSLGCCFAWMLWLQPAGEQPPQGRPPEPGERAAAREFGRAGRSIWGFIEDSARGR